MAATNKCLAQSNKSSGGVSGTPTAFSEVYEGSACETLWARQRFLGSMRDIALFGLVLMLHPLHLLGKYQPGARHFFECAFNVRVTCLCRTIFGLGRFLSVDVGPK